MLIRVEIYDNNYKRIHVGNTVKFKAIERHDITGEEIRELSLEGRLEGIDTEYLCFCIEDKKETYYLAIKFEDIKSLEFVS